MNLRPILLIEDNSDDAFFMQRAFEAAGVTNMIVHLSDGEMTLDYLVGPEMQDELKRPCLILLDLKLPYKGGFDILETVRKHELLRTTVVVMLTSSNETSDIKRCLELGANAYVVKPSAFGELSKLVTAIRDFWIRYHRPVH
jgi:DNA-binding response OmpR family regulator